MARYGTLGEYIGAPTAPLSDVASHAREVIDANLGDSESAIELSQ